MQRSIGIEDLDQFLFLFDREHHVRANDVGQSAEVIDFDRGEHLVRVQVLAELDVLLELLRQARGEGVVAGEGLVAEWRKPKVGLPIAVFFVELQDAGALDALDENLGVSVGQFERLDDVGNRSDLVNLVGLGIIDGGVVLRRQKDAFVALQCRFQRLHRGFAANDKGNHHERERSRRPGSGPWAALSVRIFPS